MTRTNLTRSAAILAVGTVALAAGMLTATAAPSPWTATGKAATNHVALAAVSASDAHHAWGVGTMISASGAQHAVVQRWNGATWRDVTAPGAAGALTSVSARTKHDVWAAGFVDPLAGSVQVWHSTGSSWTSVSSRGLPEMFSATVVTADSHVWLAGEVEPGSHNAGAVIATYHRSSHRWTAQRELATGGFVGATAASPRSAWAVGSTDQNAGLGHAVIAHWNGKRWTTTTFHHVKGQLIGIAAHDPRHAMAVGYRSGVVNHADGVALHWNGKRWSTSHLGHESRLDNFQSIGAGPGHEYWAGIIGRGTLDQPNFKRYNNGKWSTVRGAKVTPPGSAPYLLSQPVAYGIAGVPGTKTTLAVGDGGVNSSGYPVTDPVAFTQTARS